MKANCLSLVMLCLIISAGCEKQNSKEVDDYVAQLKSGQYESYNLPGFNPSEIPTLLKYVNDTTSVTKFPRNGISSFMQRKCSLGMIVLWTIESIRAVETGSDRLIGRFPSQNPILALRDDPSQWAFDYASQLVAAEAYIDWWHSNHSLRDKLKIDPLKDTPYQWH